MESDAILKRRQYQAAWRRKNKDKVAEYNRRRRDVIIEGKRRWREKYPEKSSEAIHRYFERNPGKRNEYRAAYNARKKNLTVPLTPAEQDRLTEIYKKARLMSVETGVRHHVDHIVPLAKGGLHHPNNLQVLTAQENQRKSAKL